MAQGCGDRLRAIRKELGFTQKAMGAEVGMSERGWQELEKGSNPPSGETLLKVASLGFSPTWVLLDAGAMRLDDGGHAGALEAWLMEALGKIVVREYQKVGQRLQPQAVAPEAGALYNQLLKMVRDPADRRTVEAVLPNLAEDLAKQLQKSVDEPGTGKREAS